MVNKPRISSILNTNSLDYSTTGLHSFNLKDLKLSGELNFELPTNLRLGHLAEKIVSNLIKASSNYKIVYENIQFIEDKQTIGEIDFILSEIETEQLIHLELAYKFYLFDPNHSSYELNNWVGPNKNDSLIQKLKKTATKQFPLLFSQAAQRKLNEIDLEKVSQQLCLLASLYVPYNNKTEFNSNIQKGIKGYYLNLKKFKSLNKQGKSYYVPSKKEWGIEPSDNKEWYILKEVETVIETSISEKRSLLCWEKHNNSYTQFFITWW